jgi:hypothetical protein
VCRNQYIFAGFFFFFLPGGGGGGGLVLIAVGSCRRSFKTWILFLGIHWHYLLE